MEKNAWIIDEVTKGNEEKFRDFIENFFEVRKNQVIEALELQSDYKEGWVNAYLHFECFRGPQFHQARIEIRVEPITEQEYRIFYIHPEHLENLKKVFGNIVKIYPFMGALYPSIAIVISQAYIELSE